MHRLLVFVQILCLSIFCLASEIVVVDRLDHGDHTVFLEYDKISTNYYLSIQGNSDLAVVPCTSEELENLAKALQTASTMKETRSVVVEEIKNELGRAQIVVDADGSIAFKVWSELSSDWIVLEVEEGLIPPLTRLLQARN